MENNTSSNANFSGTVPISDSTCPNCGYCPHCGRGHFYQPPFYQPYPYYYPHYPYKYWTWCNDSTEGNRTFTTTTNGTVGGA